MSEATAVARDTLTMRLRRGAGEIARFGTVGVVAYVIDVGLFNLLLHTGDPPLFVDKPVSAKVCAALVATLFAYFANRQWTWKDRSRRGFAREYLLFLLFNSLALVITVLPLAFSRYALGWDSAWADNISANIIGVALGTIFRFWSYRRWVFPKAAATVNGQTVAGR